MKDFCAEIFSERLVCLMKSCKSGARNQLKSNVNGLLLVFGRDGKDHLSTFKHDLFQGCGLSYDDLEELDESVMLIQESSVSIFVT
jgi:hypothetical protein